MLWIFITWIIVWVLWHRYIKGLKEQEALRRLQAERAETAYRIASGILLAQEINQQQQAVQRPVIEAPPQPSTRKNYYLERAQAQQDAALNEFQRLLDK